MEIRIEMLYLFVAISFALPIIGFLMRHAVPISLFLFVGGGLLMALFIMIDTVNMGQIVDSSNYSGNSTSYTYKDDTVIFDQQPKVFMVFMASMLFLVGGAVEYNARR